MTNEDDLIQKLMVSKKIMERHDTIGRGGVRNINMTSPQVESYDAPQATYNIPQELMNESFTSDNSHYEDDYPLLSESPALQKNITKPYQPAPKNKILASKLPDEIKQLMMEHPIAQPDNQLSSSSISPELAEKAARLMNVNAKGDKIPNTQQRRSVVNESTSHSISSNDIRSIVRETVESVLKENGLLVESTKKSNDLFRFRVGQHIFEGKVTKIRKVSE